MHEVSSKTLPLCPVAARLHNKDGLPTAHQLALGQLDVLLLEIMQQKPAQHAKDKRTPDVVARQVEGWLQVCPFRLRPPTTSHTQYRSRPPLLRHRRSRCEFLSRRRRACWCARAWRLALIVALVLSVAFWIPRKRLLRQRWASFVDRFGCIGCLRVVVRSRIRTNHSRAYLGEVFPHELCLSDLERDFKEVVEGDIAAHYDS